MHIAKMNLWKETPGRCEEIPTLTAFVCGYRVAPHRFPLPLVNARRAVGILPVALVSRL